MFFLPPLVVEVSFDLPGEGEEVNCVCPRQGADGIKDLFTRPAQTHELCSPLAMCVALARQNSVELSI